ncbi:MAG: GAF and HD-GYP domain-containing protein [Myxococcota bacterium]
MTEQGRYEQLYRIGVELSAEKDRHRLVERILLAAKDFSRADGGTLYLVDETAAELRFVLVRTDSLGLAYGGAGYPAPPMPSVPLFRADGIPNMSNVVSRCFHEKASVNIPDAYAGEGYDFSGTKVFDRHTGYRSKSFLTIPMRNAEQRVIGVLQLINAISASGEVVPFALEIQEAVEALAFQAAIALDNQMLLHQQKQLLESFIKLIAAAIDAKSPHTGGHCRRVPALTEMLTEAACKETEGTLQDFNLNEDQWYELHIASWLHDCGKITTPVHIMEKSTKLETISDRIHVVLSRLAMLREEAQRRAAEARVAGESPRDIEAQLRRRLAELEDVADFINRVNVGSEQMADADVERIHQLAQWRWTDVHGVSIPLLSEDEVENLTVRKGTLTERERLEINGHMVETIRMLEALPFPPHLKNVPEYAGGHHERMDGNGYPKGLFAGDMSVPARAMAIADVFEALTASDRPYKAGMPLSRAMNIMAEMKRNHHLDPELFDVFIRSKVYLKYARYYLMPEQIDEVDEDALLRCQPPPYELPSLEERLDRWEGFRPEYAAVARAARYDVDIPSRRSVRTGENQSDASNEFELRVFFGD